VPERCYVLLLVYVDDAWMDIAGNVYPRSGIVQAEEFSYDIDIQKGLYRILWGKTDTLPYESFDSGRWLVVKTRFDEDLLPVERESNRYKFNNGTVLAEGTARVCANFILKTAQEDEGLIAEAQELVKEEIVGTPQWTKKRKQHAFYW